MKKKLAVVLAALCICAMTACGGKADSQAADDQTLSAADDFVEVTDSADMANAIDEALVTSYDDFEAADIDDEIIVDTYVQAKQDWWENTASLYTQNREGAYYIYAMPMTKEEYDALVPGTKIRVKGYKTEWSGEVELTDAVFEVLDDDTYIAKPLDITEMLESEELIKHQNQFICVKDMKIVPSKDADGNEAGFIYSWDGSGTDGDDLYFKVSKGGEGDPVYTFTVESYLKGPGSDVYEAVKKLEVGQTVDMEGFLYWYESANPHVTSIAVK